MKRESRKTIALLVLLFFVPLVVWGQKNIPLVLENESIRQSGPRSPWSNPTATLDGTTLTFTFASATTSEVIIINQSSAQTVYSHSFESSAQLSIDLSEVCSAGINYLIRLNVFGAWWNGEFTVEETLPAPAANGTIVEQDSVFYQLQGRNAVIVPALTGYVKLYNKSLEHQINYPDTLVIPSEIIYEGVSYEVTGIEAQGLGGCNSTSIILPNTIQYIDYLAFCCCEKLEHMKIPESLAGLGPFGTGQFTMGSSVFAGCTSLKSVEFPEGFLKICDGFFEDCKSLTSVTLPSTLSLIGSNAFLGCTSLSSIVLPESVTILDGCAFGGCSALESIVIPEGVEVISSSLFSGCTRLSSIVLPEGVTNIAKGAFYNIADSAKIYCQAIIPPALDKTGFNNYNHTLYVPLGCKEEYEKAAYWKNFTAIVEMSSDGPFSDETGVSPAVNDEAASDGQIYDLLGRPADGTQKGIYILGGKKVFVK